MKLTRLHLNPLTPLALVAPWAITRLLAIDQVTPLTAQLGDGAAKRTTLVWPIAPRHRLVRIGTRTNRSKWILPTALAIGVGTPSSLVIEGCAVDALVLDDEFALVDWPVPPPRRAIVVGR